MSGSDRKRKSHKKSGGEDKGLRAKFQVFAEGIEERSSVAKGLVKAAWGVPDEDAGHNSDVIGSTPGGILALASGSGKSERRAPRLKASPLFVPSVQAILGLIRRDFNATREAVDNQAFVDPKGRIEIRCHLYVGTKLLLMVPYGARSASLGL